MIGNAPYIQLRRCPRINPLKVKILPRLTVTEMPFQIFYEFVHRLAREVGRKCAHWKRNAKAATNAHVMFKAALNKLNSDHEILDTSEL